MTLILDGLKQIWRNEGIRGFYSGLTPSLIGISHGAVQFMLYEEMKKWRIRQKRGRADPHLVTLPTSPLADFQNNSEWILASTLSKTMALMVTYPYQVIRSRLQAHDAKNTYTSARDVIKKTFKAERLHGFYKGYDFMDFVSHLLGSLCPYCEFYQEQ